MEACEIKEVCKFMGYEWVDHLHVKDERGEWVVDGRVYDPSDDHKQFAEIWNKLEQGKKYKIRSWLKFDCISFIDELLNDLPFVMDAVLEIVKGEER